MTPLQQQIELVQRYIYAKKGFRVKIIFKDGDNTRELEMLEHAYLCAVQYFNR